MDATLEVLTEDAGQRRERRWPYAVKARIVAETLRLGAAVAAVAQRHGVKENHQLAWRALARQGKLVPPAPENDVEFAALVVSAALQDAEPSAEINALMPWTYQT